MGRSLHFLKGGFLLSFFPPFIAPKELGTNKGFVEVVVTHGLDVHRGGVHTDHVYVEKKYIRMDDGRS